MFLYLILTKFWAAHNTPSTVMGSASRSDGEQAQKVNIMECA